MAQLYGLGQTSIGPGLVGEMAARYIDALTTVAD
jgi:hypothetical protein